MNSLIPDGGEATVLVVEDEKPLADTYVHWVDDRFEARVAYTGEEAVDRLDSDVDVALLDRRLPGIPGDEVLATIRDHGIDCRVAMLTAVDPDFDVFEMPFDDYVVKPVLREELNELVDRLLLLSEYDKKAQESFALASKVTVLEESVDEQELADNEEYIEARRRLENVDEKIRATFGEFDSREFVDLYRSFVED